MPDAAWKAFERWVAKELGGKRRGPDVRNVEEGGGNSDVILKGWSIECKKYARPTWGMINAAVKQAQDARESSRELPIAVIGQMHRDRDKSLVVMEWGDFKRLYKQREALLQESWVAVNTLYAEDEELHTKEQEYNETLSKYGPQK